MSIRGTWYYIKWWYDTGSRIDFEVNDNNNDNDNNMLKMTSDNKPEESKQFNIVKQHGQWNQLHAAHSVSCIGSSAATARANEQIFSLKTNQQAASGPGNDIGIKIQHAAASMMQESTTSNASSGNDIKQE